MKTVTNTEVGEQGLHCVSKKHPDIFRCNLTDTKIASFHSMSYDYFIKNFQNTLCIDCLLIAPFC